MKVVIGIEEGRQVVKALGRASKTRWIEAGAAAWLG